MRLPDGPLTTYRADDGSIGIATLDGTALDGAQMPIPATKAASLRVGSQQRAGFWLGDPVAGGVFVESGGSTAGSAWGAGWREGGTFNYRAAVGDGLGNSIVAGCLRAIAEAVGEPPPRLYTLDAEDERQPTKEPRDLLRLLRRPNPSMTWERLAVYVAIAQHAAGAAYLWKARSQNGRVTQLWPLPPDKRTIWPLEGPDTAHWIAGFAYKPAGHEAPIPLPADDVVYLPYGGLNLGNLRQPRSPLDSVTKQLFTDEEAADFTASVLRNFGVPGVILSPEPAAMGSGGTPTQADLEQQKAIFKQKFSGASRGEPMALRAPYRVSVVSYSPEQMRLDRLQMLPEARVCSALGVPPIVALLLSGLEQATYSNAKQMREQFIEQKMVPYWRLLESDLTWALLPEFGGDPERAGISLDLQDVRALQEDQDAKYKRMTDLAARGLVTINQVQQELGFKGFGPDGDVLLIPTTSMPTPPADLLPKPEPAAPVAGDGLALPPPNGVNGTANGTSGQARLGDLQRLPAVVANGTNGRAR
jgi:HK97 family phage portal protein